jgi:hypothetical protein
MSKFDRMTLRGLSSGDVGRIAGAAILNLPVLRNERERGLVLGV